MKPKKTRMPKTCKRKWISTYVEYQLFGDDYVKVKEEGYWYEGPMALATTPPNLVCSHYGFYDDGTESAANELSVDSAPSTLSLDTTYLFRVDIEEDSGNIGKDVNAQFQYRVNTGGGFGSPTDVNATSTYVRSNSSSLTDGGDTAAARLGGTYTYDTSNEGQDDVDGLAGGVTTDLTSTGCEFVFAFQLRSADLSNGDIVEFSAVINASAGTPDSSVTYPTWPQYTISIAAPVTRDPPAGAITLTGTAPTVGKTDDIPLSIPAGSVALTGAIPSIDNQNNVNISVPSGSVAINGAQALARVSNVKNRISPPGGTLLGFGLFSQERTWSAYYSSLRHNEWRYGYTSTTVDISVPAGSITLTGAVPAVELTKDIPLDIPAGSITLTGAISDVDVTKDIPLDIPAGAITLTGAAPTIEVTADIPVSVPAHPYDSFLRSSRSK